MDQELDDLSDGHEEDIKDEIIIPEQQPTKPSNQTPCEEIALEDLIQTLSPAISYTPIVIPLKDGSEPIVLPRRDLYDARYQIISEHTLSDTDDSSDDASDDDDDLLHTEAGSSASQGRVTGTGTAMDVHVDDPDNMNIDKLSLAVPHREEREEGHPVQESRRTRVPPDASAKKLEQKRRKEGLDRIQELQYIDAPSDVVPNIYEGGLKTWECSIDVVQYLSQFVSTSERLPFRGRSVLEVGCGTAVPTAYILQSLFNEDAPSSDSKPTILHVQDYNQSVLELVTLPNLLLAWYSSNASSEYKSSFPEPAPSPTPESDTIDTIKEEDEMDEDPRLSKPSDPRQAGDVDLTPPFLDAFRASLAKHNIRLRFSAGSWDSFMPRELSSVNDAAEDRPYDLIVTSETIYRMSNVPSLLAVLRMASAASPSLPSNQNARSPGFLSSLLNRNRSPTTPSAVDTNEVRWTWSKPLVLVAAKVLYFGVGGSVDEFESMAQEQGANLAVVHETKIGVGRKILRLSWS